MIGAIFHFRFIALFLLPNIIYYFSTTVPVWIQQFVSARLDNTITNIKSVSWIKNSDGCFQLRIRRPKTYLFHQEQSRGHVCKICIPEISSVWHPFSFIHDHNGDLLILMRAVGPFTKALLDRCLPPDCSLPYRTLLSNTSVKEKNYSQTEEQRLNIQSPSSSITAPKCLVDATYESEYR